MVRWNAASCNVALAFIIASLGTSSNAAAQQQNRLQSSGDAPAHWSASSATRAASAPPIDYDTARLERRLDAVRATGPIVLDGVLDEPSWRDAPMATHFIQNDPREGEAATYDTEVRVLYDDEAIYFGVFARDEEPGRLTVNDLKKDFNTNNSDGFRIVLDTFHDARNGYTFATNPAGAKYDAQMANEGRERNSDWDGIWDVATRVTETGWYAELRIPFRTLKFESRDTQTWGVNFERKLRRLNEDSYWSPLPRIYDLDRVSMAGTVEGFRGLRPGMNLRFKPYAATTSSTISGRRTTGEVDAGLDVKYGVTSGLVWDFTVNTDFSQVEADEQQINLTRFSLFFPEKRDFFLENSGIFQFGTNAGQFGGGGQGGGGGGGREMRLFFSRRIGLSDAGEPIPILGGTRLTGRQGAFSLGVLNIQQRETDAVSAANFTALRLRRDILANSDIGAVFLNKEQGGPHFNRIAGVDANFRFGDFSANAYLAKSFSPDPLARAIGNEFGSRAGFNYQSRTWQAQAGHSGIGERFNDEMGFVPRQGIHNFDGRFGRQVRPAAISKWLRQMQPHWEFDLFTRQRDGALETSYQGYHWNFQFQDGSNAEIGFNPMIEDVPEAFTINSATQTRVNPGRYEFTEHFAFWRTNEAALVSFNTRYAAGNFYDGYRRNLNFGPSMRLNEKFNASLNLQFNDISLSTGAFLSKLVTTRINYNFNTKMFFNALVQYNSDNHQWTSNLRFNIIHRPLSDFFLVYNERRDERTGILLSRAVIAKMTYLMAF
ncbi:MAG: carbohydrate binding family 9 domain-containing protein [Acidobacteria bacterium]|nr:carbohydrate binding family 9 domain-containing protein [Acidobacteriota bacterium]